jgi:cysteine-rich secretory family protein
MSTFRRVLSRRAVPAALALGMLMSILPAGMTMASDRPDGVVAAEWDVLTEINRVRNNHGLTGLRMAGGVRGVALDRSQSMKRQDYFGHVSPGGVDAGDMLRARGIPHSYWGEVIGWTVGFDLDYGARWMVNWWKNSPVHRDLILTRRFNYAGVGIAIDAGKVLWTVVLANQPDHTPPITGLYSASSAGGRTLLSASSATTIRWWGRDRRLSVRTAGLDAFTVQHRRAGGRWHTVRRRTTARQATFDLSSGTHYFRIKARDNRGNVGRWRGPLTVVVP